MSYCSVTIYCPWRVTPSAETSTDVHTELL